MIYVFKTTVKTKAAVRKLTPHIEEVLPKAGWNFDLADCDNILRIDSEENTVVSIIDLLKIHNFHCEELE